MSLLARLRTCSLFRERGLISELLLQHTKHLYWLLAHPASQFSPSVKLFTLSANLPSRSRQALSSRRSAVSANSAVSRIPDSVNGQPPTPGPLPPAGHLPRDGRAPPLYVAAVQRQLATIADE